MIKKVVIYSMKDIKSGQGLEHDKCLRYKTGRAKGLKNGTSPLVLCDPEEQAHVWLWGIGQLLLGKVGLKLDGNEQALLVRNRRWKQEFVFKVG